MPNTGQIGLAARVARFLRRHSPDRRLCVGYSGGLDSSVLLDLIASLRTDFDFRLSAVHVHHGLALEADAWVEHCRWQCAELDIPLRVERVTVEPAGQGLEAAAREARYRVFAGLDVDALALAQHRDDQAETLLLQLLRGAGMKGLAAMPEVRVLGRIRLLRPLLAVPRGELESHARARGLVWVEDASNRDTRLRRNALRHRLLPLLEAFFPGATSTLAQAAAQFAQDAALLDELALRDGAAAQSIEVAHLAELETSRARNLLRHFLELHGVPMHRERLHEALAQMLEARPGAEPRVDFGAVSLRRFQGRVLLTRMESPAERKIWHWQGESELDLGTAGRLCFKASAGAGVRLPDEVTIRLRAGGERLRPQAKRPARTLKNLLREAGVPPWLRAHLPLIYVADALAWAAGIGADAAYQAGPGEPGWLISWSQPE